MFLDAARRAIVHTSKWTMVEETYQGKKEDPAAFLQRLRDTCRNEAQAGPDDPENQTVLKHLFTTHCAPDIHRKLQKLPGGLALPISTLLEEAQKTYHGQMIEKEKGGKSRSYGSKTHGRMPTCGIQTVSA